MITALTLSPAIDKMFYVENFSAGQLYRVENVVQSAGGKGINVARVASILGEELCSLGFQAGKSGQWLAEQVRMLGIKTLLLEVAGESRTNINIIDTVVGTETEVLEIGPVISGEDLKKLEEIFDNTLKETSILVCSGGLPRGVPDDLYRTFIRKAKSQGILTLLDASSIVLEEGISAQPDIVKPNRRELSHFVGRKVDTVEEVVQASRQLLQQGVGTVVASLGKDGAVLVNDTVVLRAYPLEVSVVNTIGSGDSMVAGLAVGMHRRYNWEEALRLGMACATANTQFENAGFVTSALVEEYAAAIRIEEIDNR